MILSHQHHETLVKQAKLKEFYTNEYLHNEKNENFQTIQRLFFAWDRNKTKEFNMGSSVFMTCADIIANFVWKPVTTANIEVHKQIQDLVSIGKGVFWLRRNDEWSLETYYIPWENHVRIEWVDTIIKRYEVQEGLLIKIYTLKQSFYPWRIENELYDTSNSLTTGKLVPLDTIYETSNLEPIINTEIEVPAIFVIEKESLFEKIKKLVYSLDRKLVMFETQFLWEIEQFKIFQNIALQPDAQGRVDFTKIWKVFANDISREWVSDIKIISNKNELISEAIEYEQVQLQKVSSATSIPTDFLWLKNWGAISWTSREILIQNFIKTIENYRNIITKTLTDILFLFESEDSEQKTSVIWNEIITKWDRELIEELKLAREAGLVSQYTWVKLYLWLYEEEDILQEINRIWNQ